MSGYKRESKAKWYICVCFLRSCFPCVEVTWVQHCLGWNCTPSTLVTTPLFALTSHWWGKHTHRCIITDLLSDVIVNWLQPSLPCLSQSLLNVLKSLDLSHNKIQECAEFLKVSVCLIIIKLYLKFSSCPACDKPLFCFCLCLISSMLSLSPWVNWNTWTWATTACRGRQRWAWVPGPNSSHSTSGITSWRL